jgi:hypothetical protein
MRGAAAPAIAGDCPVCGGTPAAGDGSMLRKADNPMAGVRGRAGRIGCAAAMPAPEPDHGRVCPVPRTRYLKLVS